MDQPKRYETVKLVISLIGFGIDVLILVALVATGASLWIRQAAEGIASSPWLVVLIYIAVIGAIFKLIELPLSFYSGYIVEHRFGLSRETFADWFKDQVKGLLISAPLGIAGVEILYYLLRTYPDRWWIYAGAVFVAFFVVMANLAPVLILPLFFKFRRIENADLNRRVNRLASRTRTQVCGIFEWSLGDKTRKANAAVTGWGNTRRIIVSDTLLQNFSGEEIEVIMAHELCHHAKHHIWQGIAVQASLTFAGFYAASRVLPILSERWGFASAADIAASPVMALIMTGISLAVLPIVNSFSRYLEKAADLYALEITGDSLAFVSSMEKLAELNLANKAPNKIIEFIFYSHPSIEERVKLAADHVGQIV